MAKSFHHTLTRNYLMVRSPKIWRLCENWNVIRQQNMMQLRRKQQKTMQLRRRRLSENCADKPRLPPVVNDYVKMITILP
uniref:Uncharacterized protein n=1 Tax=Rhizophora mucronata TaxID=61149 RepID=A0A2P2P7W9_RHIMU